MGVSAQHTCRRCNVIKKRERLQFLLTKKALEIIALPWKSKDAKLLFVVLMGFGEFDNILEAEPFKGAPNTLQRALTPGAKEELRAEINHPTQCLQEEMDAAKAALICMSKRIDPKVRTVEKGKRPCVAH